jgi:hypothetical protein
VLKRKRWEWWGIIDERKRRRESKDKWSKVWELGGRVILMKRCIVG